MIDSVSELVLYPLPSTLRFEKPLRLIDYCQIKRKKLNLETTFVEPLFIQFSVLGWQDDLLNSHNGTSILRQRQPISTDRLGFLKSFLVELPELPRDQEDIGDPQFYDKVPGQFAIGSPIVMKIKFPNQTGEEKFK